MVVSNPNLICLLVLRPLERWRGQRSLPVHHPEPHQVRRLLPLQGGSPRGLPPHGVPRIRHHHHHHSALYIYMLDICLVGAVASVEREKRRAGLRDLLRSRSNGATGH